MLPRGAHLAEGPVWSTAGAAALLGRYPRPFGPPLRSRRRASTRRSRCRASSAPCVPRRGGGLVALTQEGLEAFDFASGTLARLVDPEAAHPRQPLQRRQMRPRRAGCGQAPCASMPAAPTGSLYAIAGRPVLERARTSGFTVANGLDWSPDGRTFYFADSAPGRIYAYDFDLGGRRSRATAASLPRSTAADGRPDGLAVDSEGFVWCAIWDGWCVRRYAPDGRLDREVRLPVPRPTSIAFGGERSEDAVHHLGPHPPAVAHPGRSALFGRAVRASRRCARPAAPRSSPDDARGDLSRSCGPSSARHGRRRRHRPGGGRGVCRRRACQGRFLDRDDAKGRCRLAMALAEGRPRGLVSRCRPERYRRDASSGRRLARGMGTVRDRSSTMPGTTSAMRFEEVTPEYWDDRFAVNLRHMMFVAQAVVPEMRQRGGGSSSIWARPPG